MSLHEYEESRELGKTDPSFYALIMAAMRKADDNNLGKLRSLFPETWKELLARYNAVGGILPDELAITGNEIASVLGPDQVKAI